MLDALKVPAPRGLFQDGEGRKEMDGYDKAQNIYTSAGHIVVFADGVEDSFKDDVLSSSLYLQLAASHKHSRFDEFEAWCALYSQAMPHFGWVPVHTHRNTAETPVSFTVWSQIATRLEGRVSTQFVGDVGHFLEKSEEAIKANAAISLFQDHAVSSRLRTLDSAPRVDESSVSVVMSFVSHGRVVTSVFLSFKTTEVIGRNLLSQVFLPEQVLGTLKVEVISAEISERSYGRVRESLNTQLGARKQNLIMRFDGGCHD